MTKDKRKMLKLHPQVMEQLESYKEFIHEYASPQSKRHPGKKKLRMPMTWNEFFITIISDWECSRTKCHCGHFYDCDHCRMLDEVRRRR